MTSVNLKFFYNIFLITSSDLYQCRNLLPLFTVCYQLHCGVFYKKKLIFIAVLIFSIDKSTSIILGDDLFILSKLPPSGNRPEGVSKYLQKSLKNLQLDYIDMYLIHVPFAFKENGDNMAPLTPDNNTIDMESSTDLIAVWKVNRLTSNNSNIFENILHFK